MKIENTAFLSVNGMEVVEPIYHSQRVTYIRCVLIAVVYLQNNDILSVMLFQFRTIFCCTSQSTIFEILRRAEECKLIFGGVPVVSFEKQLVVMFYSYLWIIIASAVRRFPTTIHIGHPH